MLTTAVGLVVAIPALIAHQWLDRRVERCAHTMDDRTTRVFTTFTENQPAAAQDEAAQPDTANFQFTLARMRSLISLTPLIDVVFI